MILLVSDKTDLDFAFCLKYVTRAIPSDNVDPFYTLGDDFPEVTLAESMIEAIVDLRKAAPKEEL